MHHKFAVVDGNLLITGSLNWTLTAVQGNMENLIITTEPDLPVAVEGLIFNMRSVEIRVQSRSKRSIKCLTLRRERNPPQHVYQDGFSPRAWTTKPGAERCRRSKFDYMFKLLIIGNSSVGKTSFLFRFADNSFTSAFVSTVGIDFKVKTIYRKDKRVKLQIWDTAGQERYRTITTAYYRGAMGFLLMYDITSQDSFCAVQDWATQIKTYSWDNAQVVLVGNKLDLEDDRQVPVKDARTLASELGFLFFEASAKDNINVKQVFDSLVDVICEKMNDSVNGDASQSTSNTSAGLIPNEGAQGGCAC
uniref:small monomeric GTPase n=1 Tax=Neogobius melanostomus TaxID=47308 RepID=A0A8C6TDR9_9GOBI